MSYLFHSAQIILHFSKSVFHSPTFSLSDWMAVWDSLVAKLWSNRSTNAASELIILKSHSPISLTKVKLKMFGEMDTLPLLYAKASRLQQLATCYCFMSKPFSCISYCFKCFKWLFCYAGYSVSSHATAHLTLAQLSKPSSDNATCVQFLSKLKCVSFIKLHNLCNQWQ